MNIYEKKARKNYNKKAGNYESTFDGKFTAKFKDLLLQEMKVENSQKVLDVACGNGLLLEQLSNKYGIVGYGVDISEKMIEIAKTRCPDMVLRVGSSSKLPFKRKSFDVMSVCAAYHHFPDVESFAREANRVLNPGGLLYIAEVYYLPVFRTLLNPLIRFSRAGDVRIYSPMEIFYNFEKSGFKIMNYKSEGNIQMFEMKKKVN